MEVLPDKLWMNRWPLGCGLKAFQEVDQLSRGVGWPPSCTGMDDRSMSMGATAFMAKSSWKVLSNRSLGLSGLGLHAGLLRRWSQRSNTDNVFSSPVLSLWFQVNPQAMAPTHGGPVASWKSAASKAATCGVWRCTALPPRRTSPARSATQTRQERLRPAARGTKRTRAGSAGQHSSQTRQKTKGWAAQPPPPRCLSLLQDLSPVPQLT